MWLEQLRGWCQIGLVWMLWGRGSGSEGRGAWVPGVCGGAAWFRRVEDALEFGKGANSLRLVAGMRCGGGSMCGV